MDTPAGMPAADSEGHSPSIFAQVHDFPSGSKWGLEELEWLNIPSTPATFDFQQFWSAVRSSTPSVDQHQCDEVTESITSSFSHEASNRSETGFAQQLAELLEPPGLPIFLSVSTRTRSHGPLPSPSTKSPESDMTRPEKRERSSSHDTNSAPRSRDSPEAKKSRVDADDLQSSSEDIPEEEHIPESSRSSDSDYIVDHSGIRLVFSSISAELMTTNLIYEMLRSIQTAHFGVYKEIAGAPALKVSYMVPGLVLNLATIKVSTKPDLVFSITEGGMRKSLFIEAKSLQSTKTPVQKFAQIVAHLLGAASLLYAESSEQKADDRYRVYVLAINHVSVSIYEMDVSIRFIYNRAFRQSFQSKHAPTVKQYGPIDLTTEGNAALVACTVYDLMRSGAIGKQ